MELEMLKTIIEKTLGRNMDAITEKTTFVDDLGVDSLDFFQILIDLEETFDVRIAPEEGCRRDCNHFRCSGDSSPSNEGKKKWKII